MDGGDPMFDVPRDVYVVAFELKSDRAVTTVTRGHDLYAYIRTCVCIIYTTVRFGGKSFGDDIDKCKTGRCEKFGHKCETAMARVCVE